MKWDASHDRPTQPPVKQREQYEPQNKEPMTLVIQIRSPEEPDSLLANNGAEPLLDKEDEADLLQSKLVSQQDLSSDFLVFSQKYRRWGQRHPGHHLGQKGSQQDDK